MSYVITFFKTGFKLLKIKEKNINKNEYRLTELVNSEINNYKDNIIPSDPQLTTLQQNFITQDFNLYTNDTLFIARTVDKLGHYDLLVKYFLEKMESFKTQRFPMCPSITKMDGFIHDCTS